MTEALVQQKASISKPKVLCSADFEGFFEDILACATARQSVILRKAQDPSLDLSIQQIPASSVGLFTSGTTGTPKLVFQSWDQVLRSVARSSKASEAKWLLTYDPASFAGLQVTLAALLNGAQIFWNASDWARDAQMINDQHVTHVSATPTYWRAILPFIKSGSDLRVITLGGEAADQPLLSALAERFPSAVLRHIYARTESGVVLTVTDGREGFPVSALDQSNLRIVDGELWVDNAPTGDLVEQTDDRVVFRGRADLLVNVGGQLVSPTTAEQALSALPCVADVVVGAHPNPITQNILVADIVLAEDTKDSDLARQDITAVLNSLPSAARPRRISYVTQLARSSTGKKRVHV